MRVLVFAALSCAGMASAFQGPSPMALRRSNVGASSINLRRTNVARRSMQPLKMGTILENGEMQLTEEECDKLKMPQNSIVPKESVEQFQQMIQDIDDEAIKKLARQIGTNPEEEPYPGYFDDIQRLGLEGKDLTTGSKNPGGMYGPDGKAYAPWMVGKVNEEYTKKVNKPMSEDEKKFNFDSRGQELSGVGLVAKLLGDEVRLTWTVEGEQNSRGYIVTKRPGGSEDAAYTLVADYKTPGAFLEAGRLNGAYSYVDGSTSPGVWVYRVQEEDVDGTRSALSQTIIEIASNEDKIKTLVAAAGLGAILTALTVASVMLDPQNGITAQN